MFYLMLICVIVAAILAFVLPSRQSCRYEKIEMALERRLHRKEEKEKNNG